MHKNIVIKRKKENALKYLYNGMLQILLTSNWSHQADLNHYPRADIFVIVVNITIKDLN